MPLDLIQTILMIQTIPILMIQTIPIQKTQTIQIHYFLRYPHFFRYSMISVYI